MSDLLLDTALSGVISALSRALFEVAMPIPDFPMRKDLVGVGMSDWEGYADRLAKKLSYTNTFFDREPLLDITSLESAASSSHDFIIASEVFEHVTPPVSRAFENLIRLLRPGGVVVFTTPYGFQESTVEHYPTLYDYSILRDGGEYVVKNRRRDGQEEVFRNPVFHEGPGLTLEMRTFCLADLRSHFESAGFASVEVVDMPDFDHGVFWPEPFSRVLIARAPGTEQCMRPFLGTDAAGRECDHPEAKTSIAAKP